MPTLRTANDLHLSVHLLHMANLMTHGLNFQILITNQTDRSLDCDINGNRYRYFFENCDFGNVEFTTRRMMEESPGKTLAWIKKHCTSWERIKQ